MPNYNYTLGLQNTIEHSDYLIYNTHNQKGLILLFPKDLSLMTTNDRATPPNNETIWNIVLQRACLDNVFIDSTLLDDIRLYRLPLKCTLDQVSVFILRKYSHTSSFIFFHKVHGSIKTINCIVSTSLLKNSFSYLTLPVSSYYVEIQMNTTYSMMSVRKNVDN